MGLMLQQSCDLILKTLYVLKGDSTVGLVCAAISVGLPVALTEFEAELLGRVVADKDWTGSVGPFVVEDVGGEFELSDLSPPL